MVSQYYHDTQVLMCIMFKGKLYLAQKCTLLVTNNNVKLKFMVT